MGENKYLSKLFRWEKGRQDTGYDKMLLGGGFWPNPFDMYLLRFREGQGIPAGVCEFREFFGPGYRIYFARESQKIVILLCGSDKSDKKRTIKLASQYWLDYQQRSANDEVRE